MEGKKNILLIGFNGRVGAEIVKKAIKDNFVHCMLNSDPKMGINSIFLKIIDGDANNATHLEEALEGKDLVVSAYGPKQADGQNAIAKYTKTLVDAMNKKGVKRLLTIGCAGAMNDSNGNLYHQNPNYPENLKSKAKDHSETIKIIKDSGIEYTVICFTEFSGNKSEKIEIYEQVGQNVKGVHEEDIGGWVSKQIQQNKHKNQVIGIEGQ